MLTVENDRITLRITEDGSAAEVVDRARGCAFRLDGGRRQCRVKGEATPRTLGRGSARREGEEIVIEHQTEWGVVGYRWRLAADHVRVTLETGVTALEAIALPGVMVPAEGGREIVVPVYQGLRVRGSGRTWESTCSHGGHMGFSMAMGGTIGQRGGLLTTHESASNWTATFGEGPVDGTHASGPMFFFEQRRCPMEGWVEAAVRLYPVDADLTAVCRRYRDVVRERGELVLWDQKIARKPILEQLFGGVMAFIGYNKTDQIDYVESAKRLKGYGFESIFFYPVRMCQYSLDFKMGGDDPIWLGDETIAAMKAIPGVHVSPWAWVVEGLDDGSAGMHGIFRTDPEGKWVPGWTMDHNRFYLVCTPYQVEHMKRRLTGREGDMAAMDWLHYDVNAMRAGMYCFRDDHELHGNRPMGRREDVEWTRRLLGPETVGNRIVSSEGFADEYAPVYDIGTTKVMPPRDEAEGGCMPVPMTMLVFHDSVVHDWWELHNYNEIPSFVPADLTHGRGCVGSGQGRLKAAMDALYGCPPNIFPFGKQYGWVNQETRETFAFLVRLEDAAVQEAIRLALPVSRLHKRIGKLQMVSHEMLSADGRVQRTAFADGTSVVANLSKEARDVEGVGRMEGWRWREGHE